MGGGREIAVGVTRDLIGRDCCRYSRAGVRLGAWIWRNRRRGEDLPSAYSFPGPRSLRFSWECLLVLGAGIKQWIVEREVRSRRSEESTGDGGWAKGTLEQVFCCGS